ncbi:hypothetical protein, partial [Pseudomonas syringae group genomosp. 3]|uniref:hypothetical protein n=1 Tax=Pseudomonas syringae group genomosp. 3 TaxID=251701 RepID=UPI001C7EC208
PTARIDRRDHCEAPVFDLAITSIMRIGTIVLLLVRQPALFLVPNYFFYRDDLVPLTRPGSSPG